MIMRKKSWKMEKKENLEKYLRKMVAYYALVGVADLINEEPDEFYNMIDNIIVDYDENDKPL